MRFGALFLRILQFCCAALGLGIFSYFLAVLADRDIHIATRWLAVEGLTGAATLYTILGILFVLCLAGSAFFGTIAIVLDICFIGAFIVVAWFTRHGADSCSGYVQTPLGDGPSDSSDPGYGANGFGFGNDENSTYFPNLDTACRLNTAVFAASIAAIFLFLVTAVYQVFLIKRAKKDKRYGPSPANNYTSGAGKAPFWKRSKSRRHRDMEAAGTFGNPSRHSGETGTTLGNNSYAPEPKYGEPGYGQHTTYGRTNGQF